jgi:type III pantothenate kinase
LGIDRVVALAASTSLYPNQNVLVIDAGSCITYDLITQDAHHLGGSISPGIEMRYRSMSTFTDQLPKLSLAEIEGFAPTTTQDAMHHGVISGIIAEIDAFVLEYGKLVPNFTIILTGGDASFLSNRVKNGILADANFLAFGLNMLLETNKS